MPDSVFAAAEAQEFLEENLENAAASYQELASTTDRRLRAAALMRLARCLRNSNKMKGALAVYNDLAAMGETTVIGTPVALIAHRERLVLYKKIGDEPAAEREAAALGTLLSEGRFLLDRPTFEYYSLSTVLPQATERTRQLTNAVEALWPLWQQQAPGSSGRTVWTGDGDTFVAVWRPTTSGTAVIVGRAEILLESTAAVARSLQVQVALDDSSGNVLWSPIGKAEIQATKNSVESGLPWTLHVAALDPAAMRQAFASRRNLLAAGFALMVLMIVAASYVVFLAVNRELGVARLQSDFVAAVSHEFRTPLTAMCHLTDMLEEGGTPEARLPDYYRALGKESRRLRATVESLLDFGRMESGKRTYHMEDTSAAELTEQVVDECREMAASADHRLELHAAEGHPRIRADRDAMAIALRNLVENAIKYSPESSTVTVSVKRQGDLAGISVEDQGMGIPKEEQRDVFQRFVRGSSARTLNVKGTGIGLAMAAQIVKAHGGRLELSSEPGRGSRFTILLPLEGKHA
jgi:signal transduction histidine kinase